MTVKVNGSMLLHVVLGSSNACKKQGGGTGRGEGLMLLMLVGLLLPKYF